MAVVSTFSGQFLEELFRGEHDVESDTMTIVLMNTTFAFDPDTHSTYADISADEIATGYGYTQKTKTIDGIVAAYVPASNWVLLSANTMTWTASGGAFPAVGAACIINNTHASETVMLCIDFGADYTTADGKLFQLNFANGLCKATIV